MNKKKEMKESIVSMVKYMLFMGIAINFIAVITMMIALTPSWVFPDVCQPFNPRERFVVLITGLVVCLIGSSITGFSIGMLKLENSSNRK